MVIVVSPLMHDKIIKIIDEIPGTNYQFIKKEGINLYFEVAPSSDEEAAVLTLRKARSCFIGQICFIF